MSDFWALYQKALDDGYFRQIDGKRSLKPEFIVKYPKEIAKQLEDSQRNKLSQIWKFYDYTRRTQDGLCQSENALEISRAELNELLPQVNYAKERNTVTQQFKDFIDFNIMRINSREDLQAFIKHFQAVIAYLPRKNQR